MKNEHTIIGIHITDRLQHASEVQKIFTEYGCNIKTRLGLHEVQGNFCAGGGIVILEMVGDKKTINVIIRKLEKIEGIEAQKMVFSHD
ncbi:MAG TPA: hypothetical protein VMU10_11130 [Desulfomonilia bacterium]|nr:hypothetical protein [Desulfomonilia bacterium]